VLTSVRAALSRRANATGISASRLPLTERELGRLGAVERGLLQTVLSSKIGKDIEIPDAVECK